MIHELAHILERPLMVRDRSEATPERIQFESLVLAEAVSTPAPRSEAVVLIHAHGDRFIRTALHLCHRADRHGTKISAFDVCAGPAYGLSDAAYNTALGGEPARCRDMPMRTILNRPAPFNFDRLWQSDFETWSRSNPKN